MGDEVTSAGRAEKRMRLRYAGTCSRCGAALAARVEAVYDPGARTVRCVECAATSGSTRTTEPTSTPVADPTEPPDTPGTAGASARREHERRKAKDEERLRQKWGRLGGVAVALSDERPSTKAWATGAAGEERLGARLDSITSPSIAVLHDRRIPRSRANIDHLAITTAGVWVVDAKRYRGRPTLSIEGGILRPKTEKLLVGRRDCTSLVHGVLTQVDLVRAVVDEVPVIGALCFVEADWPLVGGAFTTRGVHALWPKRLAKLLTDEQGPVDVDAVRRRLAAHFTSA